MGRTYGYPLISGDLCLYPPFRLSSCYPHLGDAPKDRKFWGILYSKLARRTENVGGPDVARLFPLDIPRLVNGGKARISADPQGSKSETFCNGLTGRYPGWKCLLGALQTVF